MTTIEFYQPNSLDCKIDFPTVWDDFSSKDLICVNKALNNSSTIPELTLALIKNRASDLPRKWEAMIDHEQAAIELIPIVLSILENNTLTKNPFKKYRKGIRLLLGPDDNFNNLTVGEYEDCEYFSIKYKETDDLIWLQKLFITLWRPGTRGQRTDHHGYNIKKLSFSTHIPPTILQIVYLWYSGCRSKLPLLFNQGCDRQK